MPLFSTLFESNDSALSERGSKASYSTDSDYSTLDASDASSAVQYVLLFGESVPYLARTLSD